MASFEITCTNCGRPYPDEGLPYTCPVCGGIFDFSSPWIFDRFKTDKSQPGIWRYRSTFGLPDDCKPISLGEGRTPLIWSKAFGQEVAFKCENQNPTGSFKDRGSAVITGWVITRGITQVVEDSSGNAGASLAAYATHAGINARIFLPESASGPKRRQIEQLAAEITLIRGARSTVADAVRQEADDGTVYASHAYLPFNFPGYATVAYEIFEQLGEKMPGAVIVPAGQGGLLLGLRRGFDALRIANSRDQGLPPGSRDNDSPILIGVQARACAPLWAAFTAGREGLGFVAENPTLAEGVRIRYPIRGESVLRAVTPGMPSVPGKDVPPGFLVVEEEEILPGRDALAHLGFYVEPTSAIVWNALEQVIHSLPPPIVVILTGSGYKYDG